MSCRICQKSKLLSAADGFIPMNLSDLRLIKRTTVYIFFPLLLTIRFSPQLIVSSEHVQHVPASLFLNFISVMSLTMICPWNHEANKLWLWRFLARKWLTSTFVGINYLEITKNIALPCLFLPPLVSIQIHVPFLFYACMVYFQGRATACMCSYGVLLRSNNCTAS